MIKVNVAEARANYSRDIAAVELGETVTVCRRDVPVAEVRPVPKAPRSKRPVGIDRGMEIPESFFESLPDDVLDAFSRS